MTLRSDESDRMSIVSDLAIVSTEMKAAKEKIAELFVFHNQNTPRIQTLESETKNMGQHVVKHTSTIEAMQESAESVASSVSAMKSILIWLAGLATIALGAVVVKWLGAS